LRAQIPRAEWPDALRENVREVRDVSLDAFADLEKSLREKRESARV